MSLETAALAYAARGWAVAPLHHVVNGKCSCPHADCEPKDAGKHPRTLNGIKDATTDPATIRGWWNKWPRANIALACGPSGLWALDVDGPAGMATLAMLQERFGQLRTWTQRSGRGGLHLVFKMPSDGRTFRQGQNHLKLDGVPLEKLDTRTGNGYILLAPSTNVGGAYEIILKIPPVEAPEWLWAIVAPPEPMPAPRVEIPAATLASGDSPERQHILKDVLPRAIADIEGAKAAGIARHKVIHDKAHKLGGYIAAGYIYESDVVEALVTAGVNSGKKEAEVRRTVMAGLSVGQQKPRTIEIKASGRPAKETVLEWWLARPEMSSSEVAQVWGVPATTLRRWQRERRTTEQEPVRSVVEVNKSTEQVDVRSVEANTTTEQGAVRSVAEDKKSTEQVSVRSAETDTTAEHETVRSVVEDNKNTEQLDVRSVETDTTAEQGPAPSSEYFGVHRTNGDQMQEEGPEPLKPDPEPPDILISTNIQEILDASIDALKNSASLFQRGGLLVQICRDGDQSSLGMVKGPRLRELMSSTARWRASRFRQGDWVKEPALPPPWAVDGVLARGEWPFPKLQGVLEVPILRQDGSVFEKPGYDPETNYFYAPPHGLKLTLPRYLSPLRDAEEAKQALIEPFHDFPFGDPCHISAVLAGILTLIARPAIDGPCPLFPVTATTPGSGKSLLVDAINLIASGRDIARTPYTDDDVELEKRITTFVMAGSPVVLIDNVNGGLGGYALDAALTGRTWLSRVLGKSEPVNLPLKTVWFATGNGMHLKGDLARRVIPIHLEPEEERPELRSGFRYPNLRAWLKTHRNRLLSAAYTLLAAHAKAGHPGHGKPQMGGFEEWDKIVRAALIWTGAPDPYEGVAQLAEAADERRNQMVAFLDAWYGAFTSEPQYLADLGKRVSLEKTPDLWEALKPMAITKDGKLDTHRLGNALRRALGRNYAGKRIVRGDEVRHGAKPWKVESVKR